MSLLLCVHSRVSLQCVNTLALFTAQLWNDWTPISCLCVYMPNFWVVTDVLQCTRPWCSAPKLTHTPHPLPPSVECQAAGTRGRAAKAGGGEQQGAVTCVTHHTHTTVCIAEPLRVRIRLHMLLFSLLAPVGHLSNTRLPPPILPCRRHCDRTTRLIQITSANA